MRNVHSLMTEAVRRAQDGHITAAEAAQVAITTGHLLVGTAQHADGYVPNIPLSSHFRHSDGKPKWDIVLKNERGGAVPITRANRLARTSIWAAFGGDANHPLQRIVLDKSFLQHPENYDFGTYGWQWQPHKNAYDLRWHRDLAEAASVQEMPDDQIVGSMDVLAMPELPNQALSIPDEPEHFGLTVPCETRYELPVRMGDVRILQNVVTYSYPPLTAS